MPSNLFLSVLIGVYTNKHYRYLVQNTTNKQYALKLVAKELGCNAVEQMELNYIVTFNCDMKEITLGDNYLKRSFSTYYFDVKI